MMNEECSKQKDDLNFSVRIGQIRLDFEGEESDLKKAARDSGGLTASGLEYPTDVFQTRLRNAVTRAGSV